jgi:peroxiredoxin/predicted 2-oxoglutarate/Fe(II)-dependent dioxygenase YbiX
MTRFTAGDPIPWFTLPSTSNAAYHFDTVGGHRVVLFFFGSSRVPRSARLVREFCQQQSQFAALNIPFFGVSIDPEDTHLKSAIEYPTYCKFLWDFEREVSCRFGVCEVEHETTYYTPTAFVLDRNLRVLQVFPAEDPKGDGFVDRVMAFLQQLPVFDPPVMAARQAPVLTIPNAVDRSVCQALIDHYESAGGEESGFMREVDGKTVAILDESFKKRRDVLIRDAALLEQINQFVLRRIRPEIQKAFQFDITRFERHVVACYEDHNQGFFNRHRDNTTRGTAHRRFAMTLNLNTGYEGGCLWFPEYGTPLYRPEVGEAIVFSCSLLHEVTPVTQGRRLALLSFFYNDEDAKLREQNRKYLASTPKAAPPPDTTPAHASDVMG